MSIELTQTHYLHCSASISSGIELRPYQAKAIDDLRDVYRSGAKAAIFQLATGGGKTLCFSAISASAVAKGRKALVLVHRDELLRQAHAKLVLAGVEAGIIAAGYEPQPDLPVQVASVQTLGRRIKRGEEFPQFDLIVVDECHHAISPTYRKIFEHQPKAKLLGVSATPSRMDGRGLGEIFDAIVSGPSIRELTALGFLSPVRLFTANKDIDLRDVQSQRGDYVAGDLAKAVKNAKITGDAVEQYRTHANHQPAIAFCITREHAAEVAAQFRDAGYRSACVHGGTPKKERDALIEGLGTGKVEVLTSCDLISEGLDVPSVGAVILLRPTQSFTLYMQQIGRGLRPSPGKAELIVLDHVGNVARHGPPEAERIWTLEGIETPEPTSERPKQGDGKGDGSQRDWSVAPGTLIEITPERAEVIRSLPYKTFTSGNFNWNYAELSFYAQSRGYEKGWIWHQIQAQRERRAS